MANEFFKENITTKTMENKEKFVLKIITIAICALLLCACAQQKSKEDIAQIRKVAVINTIKNELAVYKRSPTFSPSDWQPADISQWQLSEKITSHVISSIQKASPEITLINTQETRSPITSAKLIAPEQARQLLDQGYDTLLLIENAGLNGEDGSLLVPEQYGGFIFFATYFFNSKEYRKLLPQYRLKLYKVENSKLISYASNASMQPEVIEHISIKPFNSYTADELTAIETELAKNIENTVQKVITYLL